MEKDKGRPRDRERRYQGRQRGEDMKVRRDGQIVQKSASFSLNVKQEAEKGEEREMVEQRRENSSHRGNRQDRKRKETKSDKINRRSKKEEEQGREESTYYQGVV